MKLKGEDVSIKPGCTLALNNDNTISVFNENNDILHWPMIGKKNYLSIIKDNSDFIQLVTTIASLFNWTFVNNKDFSIPAYTFTKK